MSTEGLAWAQHVFGERGPHVRTTIVDVLCRAHDKCVAANEDLETGTAHGYGLIYLSLPGALVSAYGSDPLGRTWRPAHASYRLPLVNDVPIIPWRYAKSGFTSIDSVAYGQPISAARRAAFQGDLQMTLDDSTEVDIPTQARDELEKTERERFEALLGMIRDAECGTAAVLAYASSPDHIFKAFLGYASLGVGNQIQWAWREELPVPSRYTAEPLTPAVTGTKSFDSEPAPSHVLRARKQQDETS